MAAASAPELAPTNKAATTAAVIRVIILDLLHCTGGRTLCVRRPWGHLDWRSRRHNRRNDKRTILRERTIVRVAIRFAHSCRAKSVERTGAKVFLLKLSAERRGHFAASWLARRLCSRRTQRV